jgi:hypothetical protein
LIGGRNLASLPFENGRSDLLTGSGSRLDIENINLLATLLVHAQYLGYWHQLGMQLSARNGLATQRHDRRLRAPFVRGGFKVALVTRA